jgi:DNA-binding beta-propeller fold protein YncE
VDDEGNIYVTTKDHPVQVFRSSGTPLASWGSFGEGYAQILSPRGIAVDSSGKVYVADYSNRRVAVFSPDGHLLPKKLAPPPAEREGSEPWRPIGVAVDQAGRIYVTAPVETYRARHRPSVWVFSPSGTLLNSWGSRGSGDGQLSSPSGIAVDSSSGKVYVADSGNHRVQVFSADGNFLRKWGSEENYGDGMLGKPQWIAVDASGTVYGDTTRPTQYRGVRPSLPREPATNCPR